MRPTLQQDSRVFLADGAAQRTLAQTQAPDAPLHLQEVACAYCRCVRTILLCFAQVLAGAARNRPNGTSTQEAQVVFQSRVQTFGYEALGRATKALEWQRQRTAHPQVAVGTSSDGGDPLDGHSVRSHCHL